MMFQTNLLKVILCLIIAALLFFGPYTLIFSVFCILVSR